jgi:hypothetical protein
MVDSNFQEVKRNLNKKGYSPRLSFFYEKSNQNTIEKSDQVTTKMSPIRSLNELKEKDSNATNRNDAGNKRAELFDLRRLYLKNLSQDITKEAVLNYGNIIAQTKPLDVKLIDPSRNVWRVKYPSDIGRN